MDAILFICLAVPSAVLCVFAWLRRRAQRRFLGSSERRDPFSREAIDETLKGGR